MPRFVILAHDWPAPHFDFLLEDGQVLRAWRLAAVPEPGRIIPAEPLPDHRPIYLDYEGPLSRNRGSVQRVESGTFDWIDRLPDGWQIELSAEMISGQASWNPAAATWSF